MRNNIHLNPALTVLILLTACSESGHDIIPPSEDTHTVPVRFDALTQWDADTQTTRLANGADGKSVAFSQGDAIGVFASLNDSPAPNVMNDQKTVFDGTSWNYSPLKYWPQDEKETLSFKAYYPYADTSPQISVSYADNGTPNITYDNTKADIDWMAAKSSGVSHNSGKDGVLFNFKHLLARVRFKFTVTGEDAGEDYRPVVHLLQYDAPHIVGTTKFENSTDGNFTYKTSPKGDLITIKRFVSKPEGVNVSKDGTLIDEFTAYLFPCKFPCDGNAITKGQFTISLNNVEHKVTVGEMIEVEQGKSYTVNFNIKKTGDTTNFFITSYSIWEDGGEYKGTLE